MKDRIFKYLLEAGRGVAAAQILSDVLNTHSPNARSSDSALAGFLRQDPRFVFTGDLWHLSSLSKEPIRFDLGQTVVLHLQSANRSETLQGLRGAIRWADGRLQEFTAPASISILSRLRSEIEGYLLIVWSSWQLRLWNGLLRSQALEAWRGDKLKSLFFTQSRSRKRQGEIWEKEIVSRWLTANRKRLNYFDVNEVGDFASVLERLRHYLYDPDRLTHTVYYR